MTLRDDGAASPGVHAATPTARRMVLGSQLRRLRENAEITRAEAGDSIRGSESKMSRLEQGKVGFKIRDVQDLLTLYGVHDEEERAQFLAMVEESNQPGWWHRYNTALPDWFNLYVGLEEAASRIQVYEHHFVPGLLQTEDYARAVMANSRSGNGGTTDEVEQRVSARRRRQRILARPGAPRLWAVIDESVLYRPFGGNDVLEAQLQALIESSKLPHVTVQVLTHEKCGNAAEGAFTLLRFAEPELPTIVYVEHLAGAIYLDSLDEVEAYTRTLDAVAVDAETPADSRQLIAKRLSEL